MKPRNIVLLLAFLFFVSGCIQSKEHLVINKDNTGILDVNLSMKKAVLAAVDSMMEAILMGMQGALGGEEGQQVPKMSETIFSKKDIIDKAEKAGVNIEILEYKRESTTENLSVEYKIKFDDLDKLLLSGIMGTQFRIMRGAGGEAVCYLESGHQKMQETKMQLAQLKNWRQSKEFETFKERNPVLAESFLKGMKELNVQFLITFQGGSIQEFQGLFQKDGVDTASVSLKVDMLAEEEDILDKLYGDYDEESKVVWTFSDSNIVSGAGFGQVQIKEDLSEKPKVYKEEKKVELTPKKKKESRVKVYLKNGKVVEGRFLEETDKYLKLECFSLEVTYFKDEIEAIEF